MLWWYLTFFVLAAKAGQILASSNYQPGTPVVCYCSVGYRSSALSTAIVAENIAAATDVYNLEGSLFQWANEERPLVTTQGTATDKVHPYNWLFGKLVASQKRATTT